MSQNCADASASSHYIDETTRLWFTDDEIRLTIDEKEQQSSELAVTAGSATNLLDLNDDCLYEILSLKFISIDDLCSVARTSVRLKEMANQIFVAKYKTCDLRINLFSEYNPPAERILFTFGALISELFIGEEGDVLMDRYCAYLLDLVTKCCSVGVLESLHLYECYIPEELTERLKPFFSKLLKLRLHCFHTYGKGKELFNECKSLVELKISDGL